MCNGQEDWGANSVAKTAIGVEYTKSHETVIFVVPVNGCNRLFKYI